MNDEENIRYYDDNEENINPNLISKPDLCITCRRDDDENEEILCNLNRLDQAGKKEFTCYAYESKYEEKNNNEQDEEIKF
jgi:hypothetical protein